MFSLDDKTFKSKLILPLQASSLPVEFILIAISRNAAKLQISLQIENPICSRGVICKIFRCGNFANSHWYRYKKVSRDEVFSTGVIYNHQKQTCGREIQNIFAQQCVTAFIQTNKQ